MSSVALKAVDLDFSYGQLQVLFGVSLDVRQGEALALLGTNGAGKSTLLRVIAGLEKPSKGTISYFDDDITGLPAERLPARGLLLVVGGRGGIHRHDRAGEPRYAGAHGSNDQVTIERAT